MRLSTSRFGLAAALLAAGAAGASAGEASGWTEGRPEIRSLSALAFGPQGVLFVGDGKGGAVFALDLGDTKPAEAKEPPAVSDVEGKLAALLGTTPEAVMIHDLAVNPISRNVYLAVSRGRSAWNSAWLLPNDVADANVLLRVDPQGAISEVRLDAVRFLRAALPNPVDPAKKHSWKEEIRLRADTITDMAYADGRLWVAGLSNEEFASTLWRIRYPFESRFSATTLEIYHGAHGKFETDAPIRTFVPYQLNGSAHLLASYLCTPFVTFEVADLEDGRHVKGRTIGEFGSGNYPLDMVVYTKQGRQRLLIANSNLPFMIVDPADVAAFEGEIVEEVSGYTGGVRFESRSGTGVQQLDNYGADHVVALRRLPGGTLDLLGLPVVRF